MGQFPGVRRRNDTMGQFPRIRRWHDTVSSVKSRHLVKKSEPEGTDEGKPKCSTNHRESNSSKHRQYTFVAGCSRYTVPGLHPKISCLASLVYLMW